MSDDHIKILEERLKAAEEALAKQQAIPDSMNRYAKRGLQVTIRELSKTNAALEIAEQQLVHQNQQLADLNRLKDQFMGVAAHDLRNPLNMLNGLMEVLALNLNDERWHEERSMLDKMKEITGYMNGLVSNFLDHNMIQNGKFPIRKASYDLHKIMKKVVSQQELKAKPKHIAINVLEDAGLHSFLFDPERMSQVFQNLLGNAIKFSPPHTNITLRALRKNSEVHLWVEDEGPGIPEDELNKIFEPFEQTSVQPTDSEKGSGLGLYIVKKIVEAHEGAITIGSTLNEGTSFQIILPYLT